MHAKTLNQLNIAKVVYQHNRSIFV